MRSTRRRSWLRVLVALAGVTCSHDSPTGIGGGPSQLSITHSTLAVSTNRLVANGQSKVTITITPKDGSGTTIVQSNGAAVYVHVTGGTATRPQHGADGSYTSTLTVPSQSGADTVTADLWGYPMVQREVITLDPGPPSATGSSFYSLSNRLYADGKATTLVYLVVADQFGNAIPNAVVALHTTKGTLTPIDSNPAIGYFVSRLTAASGADTAAITATVNGAPLGPTVVVAFVLHDIWVSQASMPLQREYLGSGVSNGILYAVGGDSTDWGSGWVSSMDAYDPATDAWTPRRAMPTPRRELAVAELNGLLYAVGGRSSVIKSTLEVYDPATDSWSAKTSLPSPRSGLGVAAVGGVLIAIGGDDYLGNTLTDVETYDLATDHWSAGTSMLSQRAAMGVAVVNGIVYAIGGRLDPTSGQALATVESYDPGTATWTRRAPMPTARWGVAVAVFNGKIYAIGGAVGTAWYGRESDVVEVYDPTTDHWSSASKLDFARYGAVAGVAGGSLYVAGGGCVGFANYCGYIERAVSVLERFVP